MSLVRAFFRTTMPALGLLAALSATTLGAAETTVLNTHCPVSGKPVDPSVKMVMMTVGEGADAKSYKVAFCSHECCVKFAKDPSESLNKWIGPKGGDTRKGQ
jgi:hypothetical protein